MRRRRRKRDRLGDFQEQTTLKRTGRLRSGQESGQGTRGKALVEGEELEQVGTGDYEVKVAFPVRSGHR